MLMRRRSVELSAFTHGPSSGIFSSRRRQFQTCCQPSIGYSVGAAPLDCLPFVDFCTGTPRLQDSVGLRVQLFFVWRWGDSIPC